VQAQMTLKHGFYLSQSVGNIDADISGKHQDFAAFMVCILNCNQKNGHWKFPHHRWWHLQSRD
jgi:dUTPase